MPNLTMPKPSPPYWCVIFTSQLRSEEGYAVTAERMLELAGEQPGFLGIESVRDPEGLGITVSYWQTEADIHAWGQVAEHRLVQDMGHRKWYRSYTLRTCRVEAERSMDPS